MDNKNNKNFTRFNGEKQFPKSLGCILKKSLNEGILNDETLSVLPDDVFYKSYNSLGYVDESFFYLEVELPGVRKEDINVGLSKEENIDILKVLYKRKNRILIDSDLKDESLRFYLKDNLDLEKIDISFVDGMLLVKIPRCSKPEFDKPLTIN